LTVAEAKRQAGRGSRAGTQVLTLLSTPIVVHTMEALAEGPRPLIDLRRQVGSPPQTTMRAYLRTLTETGAVTKLRQNDFPGSLEYELTAAGRDLWSVALVLRAWLAVAPDGPVQLGSTAAKSAIKALVEAWDTRMVRALAARPLSLTDLNSVLSRISYPSLERRLAALRMAGMIEKAPSRGPGRPYAASEWLRRAVSPLAAAVRWERLNAAEETPTLGRLDVEAALLLAMPLLSPPADLSGVCRLVIELQPGNGDRLAGVLAEAKDGQIATCSTKLRTEADAWISGSIPAWLRAVIEHDLDRLEIGGDCQLARGLLDGLHEALFGASQPDRDLSRQPCLP
jgi:DNA-binding HxlR family transcriptional regulator